MAEFLPQGIESVPSPNQIAWALFQAATAAPATLTGPPADRAKVLLRPESNELVFKMAASPFLSRLSPQLGKSMGNFLHNKFDIFQEQQPERSFLDAVAGGQLPAFSYFMPMAY